jgi:hypothetical protein
MQGDGYETAQIRLERELLARFKFLDLSSLKDKKGPMLSQMAAFVLLFPAYLLVIAVPKWLFLQAKPFFKMQKRLLKGIAKTFSKLLEKGQLAQKRLGEKIQEMLSFARKVVAETTKTLMKPIDNLLHSSLEKFDRLKKMGIEGLQEMLSRVANLLPKFKFPKISLPELQLPNFSLPKIRFNFAFLSAAKSFYKNALDKSLTLVKPLINGIESVRETFESFLKQIEKKSKESLEKVLEIVQRPQEILSKIIRRQLGRAKGGVDAVLAKAKQTLQQATEFGQQALHQVIVPIQLWVMQPVINFFVPLLQRVHHIKGFAKKKGQSYQRGKEVVKELVFRLQKKVEKVYDFTLNVVNGVVDAILKLFERLYHFILKGVALLKKAKMYLLQLAHFIKHCLRVAIVAIKILAKFAYMLLKQMIQDFNRLVNG